MFSEAKPNGHPAEPVTTTRRAWVARLAKIEQRLKALQLRS
jgi:hypothetical protein